MNTKYNDCMYTHPQANNKTKSNIQHWKKHMRSRRKNI